MPPPIPLSLAAARYSTGSQSGSASSSANRGLIASQASSGDDARFETARLLIDRVGGTLSRDAHGSHWEAVFHFPDQLQSRVCPGEPPNRLGLEPEFPAGTTTGPGPSPF